MSDNPRISIAELSAAFEEATAALKHMNEAFAKFTTLYNAQKRESARVTATPASITVDGFTYHFTLYEDSEFTYIPAIVGSPLPHSAMAAGVYTSVKALEVATRGLDMNEHTLLTRRKGYLTWTPMRRS